MTGIRADPLNKWLDLIWLSALALWSAVWCCTASARVGATYDEPLYIDSGSNGWRTDWSDLMQRHGVMPLPPAVSGLPLHIREECGAPIGAPIDHIGLARTMTVGWLILLYVSALRLGRAAAGPWAGRIAAGLLAVDPTFLGHGTLATTDIPITASLMAFTHAVYAGRSGGWWRRFLLPGLWFAVAVLAKLSALLYGGLILVVLETAHRLAAGSLARPAGASLGYWARAMLGTALRSGLAIAAVVAIGIAIAVLVCGVSAPESYPLRNVLHMVPRDHPAYSIYERCAEECNCLPNAVVAFAFQWGHNLRGRATFLNGVEYPEGVWFYFPVLMAMKTPLPVLLLGCFALFRPRAVLNPLIMTAIVLLAATMWQGRIQIGLRLAFPVMALAYVAVAVSVVRGWRCRGVYAGLVAIALTAGVSIWIWPHGVCYLNQLFGGPDDAVNRMTDSNHDWGQGIPDLKRWHRVNGEPPIALWYFGTDPNASKPPFEMISPEGWELKTGAEFRARIGPRVLAVGATVLSLQSHGTPGKAVAVDYLRSIPPTDRTATFFIYDFRQTGGR